MAISMTLPEGEPDLRAERADMIVTIADQGSGFVPDEIDPLAPENLLKDSGRGIFLMRAFMDEVRFGKSNSGTEITLIKRLQGNDLDRQEAST